MIDVLPQPAESLPESCIRGPELSDPAHIAAEIQAVDQDALAAYQHGAELLIRARALLNAQTRLEELRQTRAFLLRQLETLERQDPEEFAAALAAYDRQRTEGRSPELEASQETAPYAESVAYSETAEEDQPCDRWRLAAR
jgi:hypothetical protein